MRPGPLNDSRSPTTGLALAALPLLFAWVSYTYAGGDVASTIYWLKMAGWAMILAIVSINLTMIWVNKNK